HLAAFALRGRLFFVLLVDDDQVVDADLLVADPLAELEELVDGVATAGERLDDVFLAALDAAGDLHLPFAREKGYCAHLAQVRPDGIVGLLERPGGGTALGLLGLVPLGPFL